MQSNPTMFKAGMVIIMVFIIGFFTGIGALATFLYIKGPPVPFFTAEDGFHRRPKPPLRPEQSSTTGAVPAADSRCARYI